MGNDNNEKVPTLWQAIMEWIEFLNDHHIPYVTHGPNTKRGEVSIKCPWCGEDDPSEHLGINLTHSMWGCHRNATHRGKSPGYLIQSLLGCSKTQAKLVLAQYDASDPEAFTQALAGLDTPPPAPPPEAKPLVMPHEFFALRQRKSSMRFCNYLYRRGFDNIDEVGRLYKLRYCTTGRWQDRIIFPVFRRGKLLAWTGRALGNPVNAPRYLSTSDIIKQSLFNEDELFLGGKTLFVTEGPIDAVKIDYYGRQRGAAATCVFGTSITIDQIAILRRLVKKFTHTVLLFDPDAIETSFNIADWLPEAIIGNVPEGVEDPGAMTKAQVLHLADTVS